MVSKAIKRSLNEVEYRQHAWIDDDPRGAFVDGMHYLPRPYQVGDQIPIDAGLTLEVTETFGGFDFHTGAPVRCFNAEYVCHNCGRAGNHREHGYSWGKFVCSPSSR